jgi:hypothetical protein
MACLVKVSEEENLRDIGTLVVMMIRNAYQYTEPNQGTNFGYIATQRERERERDL